MALVTKSLGNRSVFYAVKLGTRSNQHSSGVYTSRVLCEREGASAQVKVLGGLFRGRLQKGVCLESVLRFAFLPEHRDSVLAHVYHTECITLGVSTDHMCITLGVST